MASTFQENLDRFFADFAATAARQRPDEALTIDLVRSALSRKPKEEEAVYSERCQRILNAYTFVVKHAAAFRNLQILLHDGHDSPQIEGRAIFALYLFFGSGDLYLSREPKLELVLDAVLQAPDGTKE